jgi:hypothetical protein
VRSIVKVAFAPWRPGTSSVSPRSRSGSQKTSSRKSSPVGEEWRPIFRSGFDCTRPGMPFSRTKLSTFRCFGSVAPSSSLQMKTIVSAYGPFVMNVLLPFSR